MLSQYRKLFPLLPLRWKICCPIRSLPEIRRFPGRPPGGARSVAGTPALRQRHGSRREEGGGGEGEEGEEVDVRADGEAARKTEGVGEQEKQAVHGEAAGQTKGKHKGLRPTLGQEIVHAKTGGNVQYWNTHTEKYKWILYVVTHLDNLFAVCWCFKASTIGLSSLQEVSASACWQTMR